MQNRSIVETNPPLQILYAYFEIWQQRLRRQAQAKQQGTNSLSTNSFRSKYYIPRYDYL